LEKLDSFQGHKEDIDKRRKKKEDVQVSGTPRAIQTPADIENHEHDENPELFKFQDSPHHAGHKEDSFGTLKSRKGHVVEPSLHM
jgi:hypothetical protein